MGPEVPEPSDAELLRRHVTGDTAAFGLLFQRHKDRLWAVALRISGWCGVRGSSQVTFTLQSERRKASEGL